MKPLNPVMAALLAASSAAFALPTTAFAAPTAVHSCLDAIKTSTVPLDALTCLVFEKPAARAAVGERLAQFLKSPDSKGRFYMTPKLLKDKQYAGTLKGILAEAKGWPEAMHKGGHDKTVALLYFVIGPGKAAHRWADVCPALNDTLQKNMPWAGRMETALFDNGFTGGENGAPGKNQISEQNPEVASAVQAFFGNGKEEAPGAAAPLSSASYWAGTVFMDSRTQPEIVGSIVHNKTQNEEPTPVQGTTDAGGGGREPATGQGLGFDDLYRSGAAEANVQDKGDDGYRDLSVKVYSVKNGDHFDTKIGIVDITGAPGYIDSLGYWVPIPPSAPVFLDMAVAKGDTPFTFPGREVGGRHYNFHMEEDGTITISRAIGYLGAVADVFSHHEQTTALTTSVGQLLALHADQIAHAGTVKIGDEEFSMMGQGGLNGSALFFHKGETNPAAMANLTEVRGGATSVIGGAIGPDMGTINGKAYHMEFNKKTGLWEVKEGAGDQPPAPDDGKGPTPGKPVKGPLSEAVKAAKKAGWKEIAKGFTKEALTQLRIMTKGDQSFEALFDPALGVTNNSHDFTQDKEQPVEAHGAGNYVALKYEAMTQYFTPKGLADWTNAPSGSTATFTTGVLDAKLGMQNVKDVEIAKDILDTLAVKPAAAMMIAIRAQAKKCGADYSIGSNAQATTISMACGSAAPEVIWPNHLKAGDAGSVGKSAGVAGPGTAFEASSYTTFPTGSFDFNGYPIAPAPRPAPQADIVLYTGAQPDVVQLDGSKKAAPVWLVMISYLQGKNSLLTKPIPVFGGDFNNTLPMKIAMKGLSTMDVGAAGGTLSRLTDSTPEGGAFVVYRIPGPEALRKAEGNCAPVIWWGTMTEAAALKACEDNGR